MSTVPSPNLPKSKIPAWERRRRPDHWKWNGERRNDPHLPRLDRTLEASPRRVILYALAGTLAGLGILLLTLR
jgi:hypothetical protein